MSLKQGKGLRMIAVDSAATALRAVSNVARELGFQIKTFSDPAAALDRIKADGTDLVVCGLTAPPLDGFELLRQIKSLDPACDVILVTPPGDTDAPIRALRDGAADFLEGPVESSALIAVLERTRRSRQLAQEQRVLTDRVAMLNDELAYRSSGSNVMVGESPAMRKVAEEIVDYANSSATVLILGESGTGKEVIARAIHQSSARRDQPFLTLNCASIADTLFESEVFGHRRGAFTGAVENRAGYMETARGGSLFLDEIGDLPLGSQAKLLRLVEQKTYLPVGESRERQANVRIIAATNQRLDKLVEEKRFRLDLYYRLSVCAIEVPPLRQRKDDLPLLASYFTLQFASEMKRPLDGIEDEALQALATYDFPGNVRELRNIIERSIIRCKHSGLLNKSDLPYLGPAAPAPVEPTQWPLDTVRFQDVERRLYEEALRRSQGNVSSAARLLGIDRSKVRRRLRALNLHAAG